MDNYRSVVSLNNFGKVIVKLNKVMDEKNITRNKLSKLTGAKFDVVDRYYKGENIELVDLIFMAKVCYVLKCKIEDVLEYREEENSNFNSL